jgi:hypothetical protein
MPQIIGDPLLPGAPKTKESVVQSPMAPPGDNFTRNYFSLMLSLTLVTFFFETSKLWAIILTLS